MAVPICGTVGVDGKVSVKLAWTPASGAVSETVRICVYGAGCVDYANALPPLTVSGLTPNVSYAWSVISRFANGATTESKQAAFTTPSAPSPIPPTNLRYKILREATSDKGALVRFTWTKTQGQLQYENFLFGKPGRSLTTVEDTRTIYPDQPPQVDKDDVDPGDYGWYIRGLLSGGIELEAPIQALNVTSAPEPFGPEVLPVTLWHAINYWVSYWQAAGKIQDLAPDIPAVSFFAALSYAESRWILCPCAVSGNFWGPWQIGTDSDFISELGSHANACVAWLSTKVAIDHMMNRREWTRWQPNQPGYINGENGTRTWYNRITSGTGWDGFSAGVHRVSRRVGDPVPCTVAPNISQEKDPRADGSWSITFRLFNDAECPAAFTVIALQASGYDVLPGPDLWMPDWSGELLLSPAIPMIPLGGNPVGRLTVNLKPKVPNSYPPITYWVYGENVGINPRAVLNAQGQPTDAIALDMITGTIILPVQTPSTPTGTSAGQRLNADIAFDHQGPATILDANVAITGSGLVKQATLRIPVGNDRTPRRYAATVYLGKVTDVDPKGEWQVKATIKHKGRELISRTLARAYLVS